MTPLALCKCLADETRLNIVLLLRLHQERCVCDIVDHLGQPQPTVSRHLAQLRQCGLLVARRDAQWMYYRLDPDLPAWVDEVLTALATPLNAMGVRTTPGSISKTAMCR